MRKFFLIPIALFGIPFLLPAQGNPTAPLPSASQPPQSIEWFSDTLPPEIPEAAPALQNGAAACPQAAPQSPLPQPAAAPSLPPAALPRLPNNAPAPFPQPAPTAPPAPLPAQPTAPAAPVSPAQPSEIFYQTTQSRYYRLQHPFDKENGAYLARRLDAYFSFFNRYFHFDAAKITSPFSVKIFANQADFRLYLTGTVDTHSDFVFIQYADSDKNELVGVVGDASESFYKRLQHYAFVQYFRYFVPNPPLWIEKGFSVYFAKSKYREERDKVYYKENLAWLNPLKEWIQSNPEQPLDQVLFSDAAAVQANPSQFYAYSWGVLNFLLNYPNSHYNRIIWDSIQAIASAPSGNDIDSLKKIFYWVNAKKLNQDFVSYINGRNTFSELAETGIQHYNHHQFSEAKTFFLKAILLEDENFIPYYYLGLVAYAEKDYAMAEFYYHSALQLNGDKSLCYYALGINAYATKDYTKTEKYFAQSQADSDRFREAIQKILTIVHSQQAILQRVKNN